MLYSSKFNLELSGKIELQIKCIKENGLRCTPKSLRSCKVNRLQNIRPVQMSNCDALGPLVVQHNAMLKELDIMFHETWLCTQ